MLDRASKRAISSAVRLPAFLLCGMAIMLLGPLAASAAAAPPSPPFNECPAVGYNTSCSLLIYVQNGGTSILDDPNATESSDPTPGTYDGDDDTLIGIVNDSSTSLSQISLSSATEPIMAFDGDGICENPNTTSGLPGLPASDCADVNPIDTTTYGGPDSYFTNISADYMSGTVNFITPLAANGGTTYFSLEEALTPSSFVPPTSITTSLSGAGQGGGSITVPGGAAVTDSSTLSGDDAATATGTVTYNVYSDANCSDLVSGPDVETIITPGAMPDSQPVTLTSPGTYYWQASYSGDANDGPSMSTCGSEVETVAPVTYTGDAYDLYVKAGSLGATTVNQVGPIATMAAESKSHTVVNESLPQLGLKGQQFVSSVVTGNDVSTGAASTNGLSLGLPLPGVPEITTGEVKSTSQTSCDASTGALSSTGSTTITSLKIGTNKVKIPSPIPTNDKISLGALGSVTLKEQTPITDGLAVNAIDINLLTKTGLGTVQVIIGHSESDVEGC
jgi:hypothetical protein